MILNVEKYVQKYHYVDNTFDCANVLLSQVFVVILILL